jgi:hypothetical protein
MKKHKAKSQQTFKTDDPETKCCVCLQPADITVVHKNPTYFMHFCSSHTEDHYQKLIKYTFEEKRLDISFGKYYEPIQPERVINKNILDYLTSRYQ